MISIPNNYFIYPILGILYFITLVVILALYFKRKITKNSLALTILIPFIILGKYGIDCFWVSDLLIFKNHFLIYTISIIFIIFFIFLNINLKELKQKLFPKNTNLYDKFLMVVAILAIFVLCFVFVIKITTSTAYFFRNDIIKKEVKIEKFDALKFSEGPRYRYVEISKEGVYSRIYLNDLMKINDNSWEVFDYLEVNKSASLEIIGSENIFGFSLIEIRKHK